MSEPVSQELSRLAETIAKAITDAGIVPARAEYRALFKEKVEQISDGLAIYVCPHSEVRERLDRASQLRTLAVDVEIQYKLKSGDTHESAVKAVGAWADRVANYLTRLDVGPYRQQSCDYYPFHGETLDQSRTFVSIVSCKYAGRFSTRKRRTA
ncbi:MAG: hypothetical protein IJE77_13975 [Thermoguttaceae bacterium]|jgi:hypothetical protein|nr:hypothetical protein [Thermoguttaceae bacterium]MBQ9799955.1 hypothetical protein [Thermoguttaceae bacterium]